MNGIIEKIRAYPAKGEAGRELAEARLIENSGLEGDFHAKGGERQLSLFLTGTHELSAEQEEKGLCFARFKENIRIRNIASNELRPGVCLEAGEAALEITGETKHCHGECALFQAGKSCSLAGGSLFAKVLKSGMIRAGDRVEVRTGNN